MTPSGFSLYLQPQFLRLAAFGFASGLPYLLVFSTLSAWLREEGLSLTEIGWFGLAGTAYVFKFLWAPLVDHLRIPVLTGLVGQRRAWLVVAQLGIILTIIGVGFSNPGEDLIPTAGFAVALAIFSATQDIVADAYRIDSLTEQTQGPGAGIFVGGYRVGVLASGAGALILADVYGWTVAYQAMAGLMVLGLCTTLLSPEPPRPPQQPSTFRQMLSDPFKDFMTRPTWVMILAFIAAFQVGEGLLGLMANPFYIDLGYTKTEIAVVTKGWGFAMAILGGLVGGWLGFKAGLMKGLLAAGVFQAVSNIAFAWLASQGNDLSALTIVIAIENFSGAMASALFVGFIGNLCAPGFSATQFALLTAVAAFGRKVFVVAGGAVADAVGWEAYFLLSTAAALPALIILTLLIKRQRAT